MGGQTALLSRCKIGTFIQFQNIFLLPKPMLMDLSIRPVVIPDDVWWLQQWLGVEGDCLIPFYKTLQASSFIQSMMVWENDTPVFQFDLCEALFDDPGIGDSITPGDYTLRLLFAPDANPAVVCQGLYNCIDHAFLQKEASRILLPVDRNNKLLIEWVKEAGFTLANNNNLSRPHQALYLLNRSART